MSEKSKKALLVVAFISIFVIGIFAGKFFAWLSGPDKRIIYEAQLNGALRTAEKYGTESVYLKDLTGFEWEKVCTIYHYISNEEIEKRVGVKYYDFTDYEGQTGLLFIDKNKKIIPVEISTIYLVDAIYKHRNAIKNAVYCATADNAKILFYSVKGSDRKRAALMQQ